MSPDITKPVCNLQLRSKLNELDARKIELCLSQAEYIASSYKLQQSYQIVSFEIGMIEVYRTDREMPIVTAVTLLSLMGVIK